MIRKALLFTMVLMGSAPLQKDIPVKGYKLIWSDEFNGKALDRKKWNYRGGGKRDDAWLSPSTVHLDGNGFLIMEARQSKDSILTGMIGTNDLFQAQYGYFECRASLTSAKGLYPAFWLQSSKIGEGNGLPETSGAELDIFEYFPNVRMDAVAHTLHYGGYGARHQVAGPVWGLLGKTTDGFHVFGMEWTPTGYSTFVDGIETFRGHTHISRVPEFIVLSLGVNKVAAGPLDKSRLPDRWMIDYVRVYQAATN